MKIGIYARISTRKQDELNQLDQLREFAAKQGLGDRHRVCGYRVRLR